MTTIIDSLIVELGLDAKDLERKAPKSVEALKKIEGAGDKSEKSLKKISSTSKDTSKNLEGLTRSLTGFLAIIGGTVAIKTFISDFIETNAQLDRFSRNIGLSVPTISAWSQATERLGGSAEGLQGTMDMLSKSQTELMLTGQSGLIPYFSALGISLSDVGGKARPVDQILLDIADRFSHMDRTEANNMGRMMGIDQGTLNLLLQGRKELELNLKRQKESTAVTKQQAEEATRLQTRIVDLKQGFEAWARSLLMDAAPAIEKVLSVLQDFETWAKANKEFIVDFLKIIAVGLVAIGIASAPISLTVAAVVALAAAVALLWQDYQTWKRGGDSLIDWGKWEPGVNAAIKGIEKLQRAFFFVKQGAREIADIATGNWAGLVLDAQKDPPSNAGIEGSPITAAARGLFTRGTPAAGGSGGISDQAKLLAQMVSQATGIPANIIWAQWAHETGNFTNRGARNLNNLSGINKPGSKTGKDYKSYSSLAEFATDYISQINRNFSGSLGTSNVHDFVTGLHNGRLGSYFDDKPAGAVEAYEKATSRFLPQYDSAGRASSYAQSLLGVPGASNTIAAASQGASGGGATTIDRSVTTHIDKVEVVTAATDAKGIADGMGEALDYLFVSQANTGLF